MKMNNDKCYLLIPLKKDEYLWVKIGNENIWENNSIHPLGMTKSYDLELEKNLTKLCIKGHRKIVLC